MDYQTTIEFGFNLSTRARTLGVISKCVVYIAHYTLYININSIRCTLSLTKTVPVYTLHIIKISHIIHCGHNSSMCPKRIKHYMIDFGYLQLIVEIGDTTTNQFN